MAVVRASPVPTRDPRRTRSHRDRTGARASYVGLAAVEPREQALSRARVDDARGIDAGALGVELGVARALELVDLVGVAVEDEGDVAARGAAEPLGGQVEARQRAVHLERRAGRLGRREDRVDVEVDGRAAA